MKKIIILFIVISLTSGCYDYKEINELDNLTNFIFAPLPTRPILRAGIFLYSESHRFFCL